VSFIRLPFLPLIEPPFIPSLFFSVCTIPVGCWCGWPPAPFYPPARPTATLSSRSCFFHPFFPPPPRFVYGRVIVGVGSPSLASVFVFLWLPTGLDLPPNFPRSVGSNSVTSSFICASSGGYATRAPLFFGPPSFFVWTFGRLLDPRTPKPVPPPGFFTFSCGFFLFHPCASPDQGRPVLPVPSSPSIFVLYPFFFFSHLRFCQVVPLPGFHVFTDETFLPLPLFPPLPFLFLFFFLF